MIFVGGAICLMAWLVGRLFARRLFGLTGASLLSRQVGELYWMTAGWRRLAFRMAGPATTYLLAATFAFLALRAAGSQVSTTTVDVSANGPAAAAGMQPGDSIVAIDDAPLAGWQDVQARVRAAGAGHPLSFRVQRGDEQLTLNVVPDAESKIHVLSRPLRLNRRMADTLPVALAAPVNTLVRTVRTQVQVLRGKERVELMGPVAIVREVSGANDVLPGEQQAVALFAVLASVAGMVWPLSFFLELIFSPRRPRRHDDELDDPLST